MKNYEKPEINVTSYEANDALMAVNPISGAQPSSSITQINFSEITF